MTLQKISRRSWTQWAGAAALTPWLASCGDINDLGDLFRRREPDYDRVVDDVFKEYHPPGVLAGIRVAGKDTWTKAQGVANVSNAQAMVVNSTFPIRDITKSLTTTLLLRTAQDGRLALDDKIERYVPGVPNGQLISLADLACNQSGLADYFALAAFRDSLAANPQRVWTPQELVNFSLALQPRFQPGTQYQNGNTDSVLLGMVIEQVRGQSLADALNELVFRPLGLGGTRYPSQIDLPSPAPTPYSVDTETGSVEELALISPTALAGAGAVTSTLQNLLVWGESLGRGSLLDASTQELQKGRARDDTKGSEYDRYGMGIGQIGSWWGHAGSNIGFQVATMYLASLDTTVSVMVNATPKSSSGNFNIALELFKRLAAEVERV